VRYPIPPGVHIEGGKDADGDRHALLVDRSRCRVYELFALRREGGRWSAGSGATWRLREPKLRPAGWTSADAAGLPILPLLARYQEVEHGRITHALRMTVSESRRAFVFPARHFAAPTLKPARYGLAMADEQRRNRAVAEALRVQADHLHAARVNVCRNRIMDAAMKLFMLPEKETLQQKLDRLMMQWMFGGSTDGAG